MAELDTGSYDFIYLTTYGPHVLEPMFDAAVEEYERIGRAAIVRIEELERVIWMASLLTLLLELTLIFRPLERRIRDTIGSMEETVRELEVTRERLLAAQRLAAVGDWEWEPVGGHLTWSDEVFRICGVASRGFVPTPANALALVHPEDRQAVRDALAGVRAGGAAESFEHRIVRGDGAQRLVLQQAMARGGGDARVMGTIQDITERRLAEERIRELALYDPLTGLANRRLLKDRLEHAVAAARRHDGWGAVLMLDLDNFKVLNDTQGHDAGDALLIEVGKRLMGTVRATDTIARLGGDEFVAIFEDLGPSEAEARAHIRDVGEKIRAVLNRPRSIPGARHEYHVSVSIGITLFSGGVDGVEDLLKKADVAMFEAKESGRNCVRFFTEERQASINSRTSMADALRRALENHELALYYQPQVSAAGRVVGAEALVRWFPPRGLPISPAEFIPLAEETSLILPLGEWVFETACSNLQELAGDALPERFTLSVNISPRQFSDSELQHKLNHAIARHGVDVSRLRLELTETSLFQDLERAEAVLHELRRGGLRIELDDFGTGYSSLTSLRTLPLDTLKLDCSLVRDLGVDSTSGAIVRAAIAMAKALDLSVVAEGVETPEQKAFLIREGCDVLQGFLFARPMPLEELAVTLREESLLSAAPANVVPIGERPGANP